MLIYVVLRLILLTCQDFVRSLVHMTASSPPASQAKPQQATVLGGVPVVAGVAYAPVIRPGRMPVMDGVDSLPDVDESERPAESARFTAAAAAVADRLRERAQHATGAASEVLAAPAGLAPGRGGLGGGAPEKRIAEETRAIRATIQAVAQFIDLFTQIGGLMAERVTDLRDIRDRVVAELSGLAEPGVPQPTRPSVLCAEDLAPADTAGLDPNLIVGVATARGGPTSHTAIIARQLGIPCVVAVDGLDDVAAGAMVLVDGTVGTVTVSPDESAVNAAVTEARRAARLPARLCGARGPAG